MKLLALAIAAYANLALETTLLPEFTGGSRFGVVLWVVLPFVALQLKPSIALLFAAAYGLTIDALGGGRLGVGLMLCVLGVLALQRLSGPSALCSFGRTIGLTLATSIGMSMTLFAVESLLHLRDSNSALPNAPSLLVTQLLLTSFAGAVLAGLVSTPLRIVGMKRGRELV